MDISVCMVMSFPVLHKILMLRGWKSQPMRLMATMADACGLQEEGGLQMTHPMGRWGRNLHNVGISVMK
jgi:hypothetical protein